MTWMSRGLWMCHLQFWIFHLEDNWFSFFSCRLHLKWRFWGLRHWKDTPQLKLSGTRINAIAQRNVCSQLYDIQLPRNPLKCTLKGKRLNRDRMRLCIKNLKMHSFSCWLSSNKNIQEPSDELSAADGICLGLHYTLAFDIPINSSPVRVLRIRKKTSQPEINL